MNTTQSLPARGSIRTKATVAFGVAAVSIALVPIVAFGGFGGRGSNGGAVVPPSGGPSAPAPSHQPTSEPSKAPSPSPIPTKAPAHLPLPFKVDLKNSTGADVTVDVVDYTESVVDAVSGTPGEGGSVGNDSIDVKSVGPKSLKLTWIDFGIDNELTLYVYRSDTGYRLVLIQPDPTEPADAMGYDRELILTFADPVSTGQIEASLLDGKGD